jgi:MerR family transcriptional regulator, light-induced transcriptional regulator
MATIADLSEEPKYTIKAICTQTGIRPVTLRAWERRHEVLTPYRSENRYRLYSDRDMAILRWLKQRVDSGISISSAASEIRTMGKNGGWPEISEPTVLKKETAPDGTPPERYATRLYEALIAHKESSATDVMRDATAAFDLKTLCVKIFIPCLVDIGEAWFIGKIRVTTEHFASSYIRGRLLSLMQNLPSRRSGAHILIGCAQNEQHEIGSLMLATLLREAGYRVEFLGPDLPAEDLVDYASYELPDMVILSATMEESALGMLHMQSKLEKTKGKPLFGYGGRAFVIAPELTHKIGGIYLGNTLEDAMTRIRQEVRLRHSAKVH